MTLAITSFSGGSGKKMQKKGYENFNFLHIMGVFKYKYKMTIVSVIIAVETRITEKLVMCGNKTAKDRPWLAIINQETVQQIVFDVPFPKKLINISRNRM